MRDMVKRFVPALLLLVFVGGVLLVFENNYSHSTGYNYIRIAGFEKEAKNTIDVVFLGSSDIYTAYSPAFLYENTGITSFPYGVDSESVNLWKTSLENVLKRQSPRLLVIDLHGAARSSLRETSEAPIRYVFDCMPKNASVIPELDYVYDGREYKKLSYLHPLTYYRGAEFDLTAAIEETSMLKKLRFLPLKGMITRASKYEPTDLTADFPETGMIPIGADCERYFVEFVEYCQEHNIKNILFVNSPSVMETQQDTELTGMVNYAGQIAEKYGYDYIDLQKLSDEIGIDRCEDYYNSNHLNIYGQQKVTEYLGSILKNKYHLEATELSPADKENWDYSLKSYHVFFDYAEKALKEDKGNYIGDNPDFIKYLTQQLGEDGLIK